MNYGILPNNENLPFAVHMHYVSSYFVAFYVNDDGHIPFCNMASKCE